MIFIDVTLRVLYHVNLLVNAVKLQKDVVYLATSTLLIFFYITSFMFGIC